MPWHSLGRAKKGRCGDSRRHLLAEALYVNPLQPTTLSQASWQQSHETWLVLRLGIAGGRYWLPLAFAKRHMPGPRKR